MRQQCLAQSIAITRRTRPAERAVHDPEPGPAARFPAARRSSGPHQRGLLGRRRGRATERGAGQDEWHGDLEGAAVRASLVAVIQQREVVRRFCLKCHVTKLVAAVQAAQVAQVEHVWDVSDTVSGCAHDRPPLVSGGAPSQVNVGHPHTVMRQAGFWRRLSNGDLILGRGSPLLVSRPRKYPEELVQRGIRLALESAVRSRMSLLSETPSWRTLRA
jgi:hypothetical protein